MRPGLSCEFSVADVVRQSVHIPQEGHKPLSVRGSTLDLGSGDDPEMEVGHGLAGRHSHVEADVVRAGRLVPRDAHKERAEVHLPARRELHGVGDVLRRNDQEASFNWRGLGLYQVGDTRLGNDVHATVTWAERTIGVRVHCSSLIMNAGYPH